MDETISESAAREWNSLIRGAITRNNPKREQESKNISTEILVIQEFPDKMRRQRSENFLNSSSKVSKIPENPQFQIKSVPRLDSHTALVLCPVRQTSDTFIKQITHYFRPYQRNIASMFIYLHSIYTADYLQMRDTPTSILSWLSSTAHCPPVTPRAHTDYRTDYR